MSNSSIGISSGVRGFSFYCGGKKIEKFRMNCRIQYPLSRRERLMIEVKDLFPPDSRTPN
jgi:hypothetical protein